MSWTKASFVVLSGVAAITLCGCSGVSTPGGGGPAPLGSAQFGTWLRIYTNGDGSSIRVAEINVVELRKLENLQVEVLIGDEWWVDAVRTPKAELLDTYANTKEWDVSLAYSESYNGADKQVTVDKSPGGGTFSYRESELVQIDISSGRLRLNEDPDKIIHIGNACSSEDVEKILGPATSEHLPLKKKDSR